MPSVDVLEKVYEIFRDLINANGPDTIAVYYERQSASFGFSLIASDSELAYRVSVHELGSSLLSPAMWSAIILTRWARGNPRTDDEPL